ncbi:MAG: hypothetical protein J0H96_05640 [Microbacterium ginsengisoli]|nr:hypothetical protein [Microbacterium ginsengisoli]
MTLTPSWPGVSGAATTTHVRKALSGLFAVSATGALRAGILSGASALVTARSDMNVDVQPFTGVASQFGGAIIFANDGVIQLDAPLISPTAGTNFYVVYAKQNEHTSPGTDANDAQVASAALSTVDFATARAALPPGALELATVQMPAGKASTNASGVIILPSYTYTAPAGAVVPVRNSDERAAWAPADGDLCFQIDTEVMYQRLSGNWAPIGSGVALLSQTGSGTSAAIPATTAGTTVLTKTFTGTGGLVAITAAGRIYTGSELQGGIKILIDGVPVGGETPYDTVTGTGIAVGTHFSRTVFTRAASGTRTVTLVISNTQPNTASAYGLMLEVFEM